MSEVVCQSPTYDDRSEVVCHRLDVSGCSSVRLFACLPVPLYYRRCYHWRNRSCVADAIPHLLVIDLFCLPLFFDVIWQRMRQGMLEISEEEEVMERQTRAAVS